MRWSSSAALRTLVGRALADRVNRNAGALAANAVVSSVLGLGYWWVAARGFDADTVGENAAMISTMILVAGASDIGLKNGLVRFTGAAGRSVRRLVFGAYAFSAMVSGLVAVAVVAVVPETLGDDGASPLRTAAIFVVGAMAWSIFVLQDSVLTGIGRSSLVLAENTAYGVLKLALLSALAAGGLQLGIFVSWTVPVVVLVLVVNLAMIRLVRPTDEPSQVSFREVSRYAGSDFVASSLWKAATRGLPLVILIYIGEEETAYYHVAWSIAYVLYLLVSSVSEAVVADGATGPPDPGRLRRALILDVGLVAPAAVVVTVAAPLIMTVFGPGYGEGTTTLRFMALSAIPYAVSGSVLAVARIEQRLRTIVVAYVSLTALLAVLAWLLGRTYGISGVGAAWLGAQAVVAVGLLAGRPELWSPALARRPLRDLHRAVTQRRSRPGFGARRLVAAAAGCDIDEVRWIRRSEGVVVAAVQATNGAAVVRVATTEGGRSAIDANARAVAALHDLPDLAPWHRFLPSSLPDRVANGTSTLETLLDGACGSDLLERGADGQALADAALATIHELHDRTLHPTTVDRFLLDELVHRPLDLVAAGRPTTWAGDLDRIRARLCEALDRRPVATSWIHGDYWLSNVLFDTEGAVQGIVDWERAVPAGLPELDTVAFVLTLEAETNGREFGAVVVDRLRLGLASMVRPNPGLDDDVVILLVWLAHVSGMIRRTPEILGRSVWTTHNVDAVLAHRPALVSQ